MKKLIYLFLLILLFLGSNATAQIQNDPRAFPDSNFSWNEQYDYIDFEFNVYLSHQLTYYDDGDTVINGVHYRKLNAIDVFIDYDWSNVGPGSPYPVSISNNEGLFAFLRNDKSNKKVYLLNEGDIEETLLFDFDLKYNDTVKMNYFNTFNSDYFVVDVDSFIDPKGVTRKYFKISDNLSSGGTSGFNSYLIEGIGLSFGIYVKELTIPFERVFPNLICIKLDENRKFNFGGSSILSTADSCNHTKFQYLGINENKRKDIRIFPNPADQYIQFNSDLRFDYIEIYDTKLNLIRKEKLSNYNRMLVSDLSAGLYFCKLYNKTTYYNAKFIKK